MGIVIKAEFIINDEDFEVLSFVKRAEIIAGLLVHPDWVIDLVEIDMESLSGDEMEDEDDDWNEMDL